MIKKPIIKFFFIAFFAFLLNLAWEVPHSLLYKTTTEMSQPEFVPRILKASAGDIIMVLIIFLGISLYNKSLAWNLNKENIILSVIISAIIAIAFELYAQYTHRFEYLPSMPLIPIMNIGITPVLQMVVTPLMVFYLIERLDV